MNRDTRFRLAIGALLATGVALAGAAVAVATGGSDAPTEGGLLIDSGPPETLPGPEWSWRVEEDAAAQPAATPAPGSGDPATADAPTVASPTGTPSAPQPAAAPAPAADEPTPTTTPPAPPEPEPTWGPQPGPTLPGPDYGPECADGRYMPCTPDPCHQGRQVQVRQYWQTWPPDVEPTRWVCV